MSRAFGDFELKKIGSAIVSAFEISVTPLPFDELVLIVASDGLWEFIGVPQVAKLVAEMRTHERFARDRAKGAAATCKALANYAKDAWRKWEGANERDDIAIGLMIFPVGTRRERREEQVIWFDTEVGH